MPRTLRAPATLSGIRENNDLIDVISRLTVDIQRTIDKINGLTADMQHTIATTRTELRESREAIRRADERASL